MSFKSESFGKDDLRRLLSCMGAADAVRISVGPRIMAQIEETDTELALRFRKENSNPNW